MSKCHSTISRRDFMKTLGLSAAGLGVAVATAPVCHDLDELVATNSNGVSEKWPWWVKLVDKPTVEIDWQMMQRFDFVKDFKLVESEEESQLEAAQVKYHDQLSISKEPGFTLRDRALAAASWYGMFDSIMTHIIPPENGGYSFYSEFGGPKINIPRWEASPEENTRTLRSALKHFGAAEVGVVELDDNVRNKLVYETNYLGQKVIFDDVDRGYFTPTEMVIPNKCKWAVTFSVVQSEELTKRSPTAIGNAAPGLGYSRIGYINDHLHEFLRGLGYTSVGLGMAWTPVAGYGILGGLGELGRVSYMVSPIHGALVRCPDVLVTDLPLAPTNPIDSGLNRFCKTCKKCADMCPTNSISLEEPSWDCPTGSWNMCGIKAWKVNFSTCYKNGWLAPELENGCGICQGVCVFDKKNVAAIHPTVTAVVSTTSVFNGFFRKMDDLFDYGLRDESEISWWDLKVPPNFNYRPGS